MRGSDRRVGELFSYVDLEQRVPAKHPLRKIRQLVNDALASLDGEFVKLYSVFGWNRSRPSGCSGPCCCRLFSRSARNVS